MSNRQIKWAAELCDALTNDPEVAATVHILDMLDTLAHIGLRLEIDSEGEVNDAYEEKVNDIINKRFIILRLEDQDANLEL
jgi:hypothetical protein